MILGYLQERRGRPPLFPAGQMAWRAKIQGMTNKNTMVSVIADEVGFATTRAFQGRGK
jgi:hypothetical protein